MTTSHAQFQAAFADALFAPREQVDPSVRHLVAQPAFAVYRNTVMKGCIDTLEANFPAVARLVGSEWFRAAAAVYATSEPPSDARMLAYGDRFADFLRGFAPAAELPYLPGVAQLDALWRASHAASDAPVLDAAGLARAGPEAIGRLEAAPHPAARWAWFDAQPVFSIWSANRVRTDEAGEKAAAPVEWIWQGEGALLTRPVDAVRWCALPKAGCIFLEACAAGRTLAEAAEQVRDADRAVDIAALFGTLLRAGAFAGGSLPFDPSEGMP